MSLNAPPLLPRRNLCLCLVATREHMPELATWHQTATAEWELACLTGATSATLLTKLGDTHLHSPRLFFREKPYPWTSPRADFAAARQLIERCGYWRRKEELEDAEGAVRNHFKDGEREPTMER